MIKNVVPAMSWSVFVLFVSLIPGKELPEFQDGYLHIDKIAHAILFAGLSFFWIFGLRKSRVSKVVQINIETIISISALLFGTGIECLQYFFVSDRYFDVFDILANGLGIGLGISFFHFVIYKRI